MKISRKMQRQVEIKILHAMATGTLHVMQQGSPTGTHSRQESDKADGNDTGHCK